MIAADPDQAQALAALGLVQKLSGLPEQAITSYERALALDARLTGTWVNLGRARREAGRLEAACSAFRRALELEPLATTWSMLSNALRELGRHDEALAAARSALTLDPWLSEAHLNEGAALHLCQGGAAAVVSYFVASLDGSTQGRALANLGLALRGEREPEAAASTELELVLRSLETPADASPLCSLASRLEQQGRVAAAIVCWERALRSHPHAHGCLKLAHLLWQAGWRGKAEAALLCVLEAADASPATTTPERRAAYRLWSAWLRRREYTPSSRALPLLEGCPDDPIALARLGGALQRLGRPCAALRLYQRLASLEPDAPESQLYLGHALTEQGLFREASRSFARALELAPARWDVFSSSLFCLHLDPELDAPTSFARHQAFGQLLAATVGHSGAPAPASLVERKLRIGYVSPDFCAHPVSYFLEPILRHHDPSRFEIHCYSDVRCPDDLTERLSGLVQGFVPVSGWSHEQLCERIRADQIDILVDLAGHTAQNRLPVFARRPSPVQVSWLGYFDTTGLEAIDYRIADEHSVPAGAQEHFVERVVWLPRSANCYQPPSSPPPAPPACLERGHITFGCFNNPAKINREVCQTFASILHAVSGSRLCFKYRSFSDPELRQRYLAWFAAERISAERLDFDGSSAIPEFLAAFARIDVALDPFPYGGETTALHTLWMGVPLVTLEGPRLVQRLGSRVLRICGLDCWVAESRADYVEIACRLARHPDALARLRPELRRRLQASPLLDHSGVTRELETAYRWMWRDGSRRAA